MNIGASAIVLRPRTLAEILDLACRFCVTVALGAYARLAAIVLLPGYAGCLALRYALDWPWWSVWTIAVTLASILQGVFTVAVSRLLFSEALTARRVLGLFARRLGAYLFALFCSSVILAFAASLLLLGLPFAWPRVLFLHEACLLEGAGPIESIRRSSRFVEGRVAGAFGTLLALLFAESSFVLLGEVLGDGLVNELLQLGEPFGSLFSDGGSPYALLGLFLAIPYVATARFLAYIDGRTRTDGWDIQLRFMAIAARAGAERRAA